MHKAEAPGAQLHLPPHDDAGRRRAQTVHGPSQGGLREEVGGSLKADLQEGRCTALDAHAIACTVAPLRTHTPAGVLSC